MSLALSPVEAEQLRDLRSRLNRTPKDALGDKSVGPLTKGFFTVCGRVGLTPQTGGAPITTLGELKTAIAQADLTKLRQILHQLEGLRADPKVWRAVFNFGVLQAVITRRLILGGREAA